MESFSFTCGIPNESWPILKKLIPESECPIVGQDEEFYDICKKYNINGYWEEILQMLTNKFRKPLSALNLDLSKLNEKQIEIFISSFITFLTNYKTAETINCWSENKIWFFLPPENMNMVDDAVKKKISFCLTNPEFSNSRKELNTAKTLQWEKCNFVFDISKLKDDENREKFLCELCNMISLFYLSKEINKGQLLS